MQEPVTNTELLVPDRFERLKDVGTGSLRSLVFPIEEMLEVIDDRYGEMMMTGRGAMLLLRGDSGTGKSTFLNTVGLFRSGVESLRVGSEQDVSDFLFALESTDELRIIVLEGREALGLVSKQKLEATMHAINSFVRTEAGAKSLVVWPTNSDDISEILKSLGNQIGAESLFGLDDPIVEFTGPPKSEFVQIASNTIAALNEGATLAALGVADSRARELADDPGTKTIGKYLMLIGNELRRNSAYVKKLQKKESIRLWVLVLSGNDSEGDVAALTRGGYSQADIDRLMTATEANVIQQLKSYPDELGILGTVLDAKILHMDVYTALAIARTHASPELKNLLRAQNRSITKDPKTAGRVTTSELGLMLSGQPLGQRRRGPKTGDNTKEAFDGLATIASKNDGLLNEAIGEALIASKLVDSFEKEHKLDGPVKFISDLRLRSGIEDIRLEVMWRRKTSRAEIANYVLTKLWNYARAIGLIDAS
ncbi:hypothetical protein [Glutamicibacter sp. V16R2B1]|uniref:hypothetical protein n=1 Tax=Glutamicibacter sp. V16R2B1 TaxID=2036207 RepID=UPI0010FDCAFF|nr:hypothetical protein [Glutamicibacter sp. V16R2B1]TLK51955.1 hypothetical protein FDN03_09265 [Glutamicibacter sp. V16R2B1]